MLKKGLIVSNKISITIACLLIVGCSASRYGYSQNEWNSFTDLQREEIRTTSINNYNEMIDKNREKDFINQSKNAILGTRSNIY